MKTSLITSIYGQRGQIRPIEELIPTVAQTGIDAIELFAEQNYGPKNRHAGLDVPLAQIKKTKKLADKYKLKISSISAHFPLISQTPKLQRLYINEYKKCIDQAVILETNFVHGFSGDPDTKNTIVRDEDRAWSIFREGCIEILDYAQARKISFGMEPVINHLVHGLKSCEKMFEVVGRNDLYINYDPSHLYLCGQATDPFTFIKKYAKRIKHVHIHDAFGAGIFNWTRYKKTLEPIWTNFKAPGMGEIDLAKIVATLKKSGYDGYLSIECIGSGYEVIDYITWHYNRMMKQFLQGAKK
jgi:sugar phosphate isomerase/epimerase